MPDSIDRPAIRTSAPASLGDYARELRATLRQWQFPQEFRITRTAVLSAPEGGVPSTEPLIPPGPERPLEPTAAAGEAKLTPAIAEVAVSLWDIRRKLKDSEAAQQDRKLRLLNRRAERAIAALEQVGVVIDDPLGRRYAPGSEGSMKPNFQPTPGTTYEKVVETITPVVYLDEQLIGRGEVFVAVPVPEAPAPVEPAPEN